MKLALVFEIDENPYFCNEKANKDQADSSSYDLVTRTEIELIESALRALGHEVERVNGPKELLKRVLDLRSSKTVVFNKSRGIFGLERKIAVPVICDHFKIPCVGSSGYVATLARHKYHTNRLLAGMGFRVPSAFLVNCGQSVPANLPYSRVIVKPNHEAGALGINEESVVDSREALCKAVAQIHKQFKQAAVIETYVSGEEFKVAVIGNGTEARSLGCVAVMVENQPIIGSLQTRQDVRLNRLAYYTPKDSALVQEALELAAKVHSAFECRDYSRVDFRVSEDNSHVICMEISTQPDLGRHSSFISAAKQALPDYDAGIAAILNETIQRYNLENYPA
jgi:D-alanine-D-alanine ligase